MRRFQTNDSGGVSSDNINLYKKLKVYLQYNTINKHTEQ